MTKYINGSTNGTPSFRIIRGEKDAVPENPHFKFHAVVLTNSKWYDPSYGISYTSQTFNETAHNSVPQQGHAAMWANELQSSFTCGH